MDRGRGGRHKSSPISIIFALPKLEKCTKQGRCITSSIKESVANDVINVSLFGPVCCEPRHRLMEWRRRL